MLIKNYGRFWRRDGIDFGRAGHFGNLLAVGERHRGGGDFRQQIAIYVLYDASLSPLYIGQTGAKKSRLLARLSTHSRDPHILSRWEFFSWFGFLDVAPNSTLIEVGADSKVNRIQALNQLEALLILNLEPKLNRQRGVWESAEEFFQIPVRDDSPKTEFILRRLDQIERMIRDAWKVKNRDKERMKRIMQKIRSRNAKK